MFESTVGVWKCGCLRDILLLGTCRRLAGTVDVQMQVDSIWTKGIDTTSMRMVGALLCPPLVALDSIARWDRTVVKTEDQIRADGIAAGNIVRHLKGDNYEVREKPTFWQKFKQIHLTPLAKYTLRFVSPRPIFSIN